MTAMTLPEGSLTILHMDAFANVETVELHRATKRRLAQMSKNRQFKGVFHPGSAGRPPLLVGRQSQADRINDLLNEMLHPADASRDIHAVTLHGPRGAGKTVLLDVVKSALKGGHSKPMTTVLIQGTDLPSMSPLIEAVLAHMPADATRTKARTGRIGLLATRLSASTSETQSTGPASKGGLNDVMRRHFQAHGQPLLFVIDEAHAANPDVLGAMLNGLQALNGSGIPCGAILAGTPDLIDVLQKATATWYLDRNQEARLVPVGAVSAPDCALAVKAPLDAMDIEHDERELADAAQWCNGSAYFTQTLGAAALASLSQDGGTRADFRKGGPVWERFQDQANRRYSQAWTNLDNLGLTSCARQLGALWRWAQAESSGALYSRRIASAISSGLRNPPLDARARLSEQEAHTHFTHLGLLWSPTADPDGPWELGLPSFFNFVERRYQDPSREHYHKTLDALVADESTFIPEDIDLDGDSNEDRE